MASSTVSSRGGVRRFHHYPTLLAFRSNLKCSPGSSDPSGRCGLYSRSTLANFRLTDSAYGWSSEPPWLTAVIVTSFSLMMRNSCCPLPALRWVIVASLMCSPVAHAFRSVGSGLVDAVHDRQILECRLARA